MSTDPDDDMHVAGAVLIFVLLVLIGALVGATLYRMANHGRVRRPAHLVPQAEMQQKEELMRQQETRAARN
ncbi:hypothetical protein DB346_17545 [Verrucomicrobia bacterium LW23]|nr:hypothetical protein DB346_17545 [Verrucomicrobia bacterium LW23]